ncbi:Olfactory receptor 2G6 [Varanus komodoensis]|nr:Olfactory receptor 2G6 [Varanus komodoensis]
MISVWGCAIQMYFSLALSMAECFLLRGMAYDRYVAICQPLLYAAIKNWKLCVQLAAFCWGSSFMSALIINLLVLQLPFCGPNILDHYFCEVPAVQSLACTDTSSTEMVVFVFSIVIVFIPFPMIMVSYACIFLAVLQMKTTSGRAKAFSACAFHLTAVAIFYGTALFMYMRPRSKSSQDKDKVIAMFYTIIMPMLNPLIYSLWNKDVKDVLRSLMFTRCSVL